MKPFVSLFFICLLTGSFVCLSTFCVHAQESEEEISFNFLENGLPLGDIYKLIQDDNGFIWFGTGLGLYRYDGEQFIFTNPGHRNSPTLIIHTLYLDDSGVLWIGTWGKGLFKYDIATKEFRNFYPSRGSIYHEVRALNIILDIIEDNNGMLWLSTLHGGLMKFDPFKETLQTFPFHPKQTIPGKTFSHKSIGFSWIDHLGNVWAKTHELKLDKLDPDTETVTHHPTLPFDSLLTENNDLLFIKKDQTKAVWIGTPDRIYKWDTPSGKVNSFSYPNLEKLVLHEYNVEHIYQDSSNVIWMSVLGAGLIQWNPETQQVNKYFNQKKDTDEIPLVTPTDIFQSQSGLMWGVSEEGRIFTFETQNQWLKVIKRDTPLRLINNNNHVWSTESTSEGKIWLGFAGSSLNLLDPYKNKITPYQLPEKLTYSGIWCIHESEASPETLWIGSNWEGLLKWNPSTNESHTYRYDTINTNSLSSNQIRFIEEDDNGILWIATAWGLTKMDPQQQSFRRFYKSKNETEGLPDNNLFSLLMDRNQTLWIGSNSGLSSYSPDQDQFKWYPNNQSQAIPKIRANTLFEDSAGRIWVGFTTGLFVKSDDNKGFINVELEEEKEGAPSNTSRFIKSIQEDPYGRIWVSTLLGIHVIDKSQDGTFFTKRIKYKNGHLLKQFVENASVQGADGKFYFGAKDGLYIIQPELFVNDSLTPKMAFTELLINNKIVTPKQDGSSPLTRDISETTFLKLNHFDKTITFQFNILDYQDSQNHRYAYKLEGIEDDWQSLGNRNEMTFTNLPAGEYFLRVKGRSFNGKWNEDSLKIRLLIKRPYWQSPWFIGGITLLSILMLGLAFWIRARYLNLQNIRLQEEINKQTEKLSFSLIQLQSTQSELVKSEKMAFLGTLVAQISHEINTPLGIINAANSNVKHSIDYILKHYQQLISELPKERYTEFVALLQRATDTTTLLSRREKRTIRKQLEKELQAVNPEKADIIAETLTAIGVTKDLIPFYPLFQHEKIEEILSNLYSLSRLRQNQANIHLSINRASSLLKRLKTYSYNYNPGEKTKKSINEALENLIALFQLNMKENVELIVNLNETPSVYGDHEELIQVWTNLIQNALYAIENHGKLQITTEVQRRRIDDESQLSPAKSWVVVRFINDGPEISETVLDKIFDPFFTTKPKGEGVGLGLDICKRIIESHQGRISVKSNPEETIFEVCLPIDDPDQKE